MSHSFHYRQQLDLLTTEILGKSSITIQKIEENVRLTHSLRSSNSLISQMDLQIDHLSTNLQQYQYLLTQLNSLLIRSEYLEAQLRVLETEEMEMLNGVSSNQNWKDSDLNWRTTEATLENLFLEFRFLSKKIEGLSMPMYLPTYFSSGTPLRRASFRESNLSGSNLINTPQTVSSKHDFTPSSLFTKSPISFDQSSVYSTRSYTKKSPLITKRNFNYISEQGEYDNGVKTITPTPTQTPTKTPIKSRLDNDFTLKPIVCSSKKSVLRARKSSAEIRSLNLLALKSNTGQLPTPDTTINDSIAYDTTFVSNNSDFEPNDHNSSTTTEVDSFIESKENVLPLMEMDSQNDNKDNVTSTKKDTLTEVSGEPESSESDKYDDSGPFFISPFKKSKRSRSRSLSLPHSVNLEPVFETLKNNKQANLRHFISHDTGLKSKALNSYVDSDEEDVKESQFVNSPVESFIMNYGKNTNAKLANDEIVPDSEEDVRSVHDDEVLKSNVISMSEEDDDVISIESQKGKEINVEVRSIISKISAVEPLPLIEEDEDNEIDEDKFQLPTFEHKLNRSNSCDSIFSTVQARSHVPPRRNNQQQTMNWMRQFSSRPSRAKETEISATFVTSTSRPETSSNALHSLVSTSRKEEYTSLNNLIQPSTQLSWQSFWTTKASTPQPSLESQAAAITPSTVVSNSTASKQPTNLQQFSKQWVSLLSKFKPDNLLQPQNVVTSEVGKPVKAIEIKSNPESSAYTQNVSRLQYPHSSERLKGQASTLTIGPNGSKFVNHGESSPLAQSLVVSSRISHSALRAALADNILQK